MSIVCVFPGYGDFKFLRRSDCSRALSTIVKVDEWVQETEPDNSKTVFISQTAIPADDQTDEAVRIVELKQHSTRSTAVRTAPESLRKDLREVTLHSEKRLSPTTVASPTDVREINVSSALHTAAQVNCNETHASMDPAIKEVLLSCSSRIELNPQQLGGDKATEETPEEVVTEETPEEVVTEETPEEVVTEETPEEVVTEKPSNDEVDKDTPEEIASSDHPTIPDSKITKSKLLCMNVKSLRDVARECGLSYRGRKTLMVEKIWTRIQTE